jgi:hypothetical protein
MPDSNWLVLEGTLSLGWDPDEYPEWVERMFATWLGVAPGLAPALADYGEPPRDLPGEARRLGWGWCAKRPDAKLRADTAGGGRANHATLTFDSRGGPRTVPELTVLVDAMAALLRPDWAMVHPLTLAEAAEAAASGRADLYLPRPDGRLDGARVLAGATMHLRHGLPTLYWRNYFGLPYTELVGPALSAAPWARVVEAGDGILRADVTLEPPTEGTYRSFAAGRERIMDALGRDLFGPLAARVPPGFADFRTGAPPSGP